MSPAKKHPEIAALEVIHSALEPLKPEERKRVLASVRTLLDTGSDQDRDDETGNNFVPRSPASTSLRVTPTRAPGLTELKNEKRPNNNPQLIVFFAYYREKFENQPNFGKDELLPYFAKAHEPAPKNYHRDFSVCAKKGWIHEDGSNSYITSKGIETVESGFAGDDAHASPRSKSPKKHLKKIKGK
jgi:hypothetical protein